VTLSVDAPNTPTLPQHNPILQHHAWSDFVDTNPSPSSFAIPVFEDGVEQKQTMMYERKTEPPT
jgi:hypothetical protein